MYLSHLLIDVGSNPDHPRPGRLWLRNMYQVHQRLSMAFPKNPQGDKEFLQPFSPDNFKKANVVFRVEREVTDAPSRSILLLSDLQPDWNYAFQNAGVLLGGPCQCREYSPAFSVGALLRFRILVNPTQKSREHRKPSNAADATGRPKDQGKRVALTWAEGQAPGDVILPWFAKKGMVQEDNGKPKRGGGFDIEHAELVTLGWLNAYRKRDDAALRFRTALIEGVLRVTDLEQFSKAIFSGIGHGKAFGFGLLSVAAV